MAYKYQFGASVMSGSLTQEGGITAEGNIDASTGYVDTTSGANGGYRFGSDEFKLYRTANRKLLLECSASSGGSRALQVIYEFSSSSPANGDMHYNAVYRGYDSAGNTMQASYLCRAADVTSDSERVGFYWTGLVNGSVATMFDINYTTANTVTILDGAYDFDVASHDGTNGLKLAGTLVTSTAAELNLLDAGAGSSVALADGDGFIMFDATDSNTGKKVLMSDVQNYIDETNVQNIDNSGTLQVGFNYFSNLGGAESCTLPASPSVGNIVRVKAPSNCSSTNTITINKAGSQTIDGATSIVLESPFAAVNLMYAANNTWSIF